MASNQFTKVIFDSCHNGGYAFNTAVYLATDSDCDSVHTAKVIPGNLRKSEAARLAKTEFPGLRFEYRLDGR